MKKFAELLLESNKLEDNPIKDAYDKQLNVICRYLYDNFSQLLDEIIADEILLEAGYSHKMGIFFSKEDFKHCEDELSKDDRRKIKETIQSCFGNRLKKSGYDPRILNFSFSCHDIFAW